MTDFIVMVLRRLKALFALGPISFRILFLNTNKVCEFIIPKLKLSNLIMAEKRKELLNQFSLMLY